MMRKIRIFISSVQKEFSQERMLLFEYLTSDPLLGKFFEPFLFELLPSIDQSANQIYLREVERCDIYLGIFGKEYGFEDKEGFSPTEREFDHATKWSKTRLVFLTQHASKERHPKEMKLIRKAQEVLIRKTFSHIEQLKATVYASLVRYLEEKEIIRTVPFDASLHPSATVQDIAPEKVQSFVRLAQSKRGFPIAATEPIEKILTHLNLYQNERLTNAALLLFGNFPQRFFINSEVRCASFAGAIVEKPIPSYKVFKGTVFELVDQALEFVLNKLDYRIETRAESVSIPGSYEIPKEVVAEAIVNAIAHRDYTSNASVQVMLFRDRLEIWNPGALPLGWTVEKLKQLHNSVPANPLLAEPLYLSGYIERMGTGTSDIVQKSLALGLREPQFVQDDDFRTIIYRFVPEENTQHDTPHDTDQAREQVREQLREQVREQVKALVLCLEGEMSVTTLLKTLKLKGRRNFLQNYLKPALEASMIEMTQPESPNSPTQKYRLTEKGKQLKKILDKK
jgi:ATP-dependent DNA helicase RecG